MKKSFAHANNMIGLAPVIISMGVPDVETTPPSIITSASGVKSGCRAFNRIWIGILMIKAKNKAKTFPGIAKAMAEQYGGNIRDEFTDPVKTRMSEFKKLFPNYNYPSDLPIACVREFDCTATCKKNCHECKKEFWLTPIEEEEE